MLSRHGLGEENSKMESIVAGSYDRFLFGFQCATSGRTDVRLRLALYKAWTPVDASAVQTRGTKSRLKTLRIEQIPERI